MKNFIAVLLCFAVIFVLAACVKETAGNETTTTAGVPFNYVTDAEGNTFTESYIDIITDANGATMTTYRYEYATYNIITDANGNPVTVTRVEVVTDANGKPNTTYRYEYATHEAGAAVTDVNGNFVTQTQPFLQLDENGNPILGEDGAVLTTYADVIVTHPPIYGETLPPKTTRPAGYTSPSENAKWPTDAFMSKLPKLKDNVDKVIGSLNEHGNFKNIQINELSYADYLKYIETCKKAGFVQTNTGTVIPSTPEAGKSYRYQSSANGLYITLTYYTDEYPYRSCDLLITVSDYDMLEAIG